MSRTRPGGPTYVGLLGVAMAAAASGLLASGAVGGDSSTVGTFVLPGLALAALFFLAESAVVHVQLRRQTLSISLSEIPLVLGLFFVSPLVLVAARLAGASVALVGWRRQPLVKALFNTALFALETSVMVLVFRQLLELGAPFGPAGWLAAHGAGIVGIVVGTAAVGAAIWLTERTVSPDLARGFVTLGIPTTFVNVTIGLLAATLLEVDSRAGILLTCLSAALFVFYRSHSRLQTNHESLGELYAVTRTVDDALERGGAVQTLLERTAVLMNAEKASLVLADVHGGSICSTWNAAEGELTTCSVDEEVGNRNAVLGDEVSVVLSGRRDRAALERLGGYEDAVIYGLRGDGVLNGTLMVADRLGNVATFTDDDRRLFEALGNHASIAMRNSTLFERLRVEVAEREHEALHDALTSLPNRTMFNRQVARALVDLAPGAVLNVMLIDLDRFKEVNDTLGHQQGDRLLRRASRRIAAAVGHRGVVARLGGDEFAVVLPSSDDADSGMDVAQRIRRRIEQPFDLDGIPVAVGASIGIAVAPEDASDPETLLQRADVAMYNAKRRSGIERYHPSVNHYSPERLAMVAELRRAIQREELLVAYQPFVDLQTGQVVAAEALARWHHPDHGYVPPDVFIPIAERSGLIRGVTSHILRTALRQCAAWRQEGLAIRIAVNLSARCLVDEDLPREIEGHLADTGLNANSLVLEITESSIMDDPGRTVGMLNKLSSMGIRLSIDDYGTGYSSLSYLKNLPVDELKIDRSFVMTMRTDHRDAVIVRNTIDLAHELNLRIVAEGVEDGTTQELLAEFGSDLAQGYHVCRPVTAPQVSDFARAQLPNQIRIAPPVSLDERRRRTAT